MALAYTNDGDLLIINGRQIKFQYNIRDVKETGDIVVVLLAVPFDEMFLDNVYAVSQSGDIVWRVQDAGAVYPLKDRLPYEHLYINESNQILVSDFYGRRYAVNPDNGKITGKDFVK